MNIKLKSYYNLNTYSRNYSDQKHVTDKKSPKIIILTKFDGDWTKIVDFLLVVHLWASVIFLNQSL